MELHHGEGECKAKFRAVSMRMTNRSMFYHHTVVFISTRCPLCELTRILNTANPANTCANCGFALQFDGAPPMLYSLLVICVDYSGRRNILFRSEQCEIVSYWAALTLSSPRGEVDPGSLLPFCQNDRKSRLRTSFLVFHPFYNSHTIVIHRTTVIRHRFYHRLDHIQHYTNPSIQATMPASVASSSDDEVSFQQAYHRGDTVLIPLIRMRASSSTSTSSKRMVG